MPTKRIYEVVVGVLLIAATVFGVIAAILFAPAMDSPDYLSKLYAGQSQIVFGTMLYFFMAMACAGVGLALYPILKEYHEGFAIGVVGFRVIEGVIQVVGALSMIGMLALSKEFIKAGSPTGSYFQAIGNILRAGSDWISNGAMLLPWCIAAAMYYFVFFKFQLIPRWISIWGLIGIALSFVTSIMIMINPGFGSLQTAANLPIALQEMVFAVWLIVKGTHSPIMNSPSNKPIAK